MAHDRIVDNDIRLIQYYPNYSVTLAWYQDLGLCKQVDNRDSAYDLPLLKSMYNYLNEHGSLFYIAFRGELCGDVCLKHDGEVCIVIEKAYQNKHIGRKVIQEIIKLAKELGMQKIRAQIYSFNTQSQKMFTSVGFTKTSDELFELDL